MNKENMQAAAARPTDYNLTKSSAPATAALTGAATSEKALTIKKTNAGSTNKKHKMEDMKQQNLAEYLQASSSAAHHSLKKMKIETPNAKESKTPTSSKVRKASVSTGKKTKAQKIADLQEEVDKIRANKERLMSQRRFLEKKKYPIADELLNNMDNECSPTPLPKPRLALPIDDPLTGDVITLWNFLYRFSNTLSLSTFTVDLFIDALGYCKEPTVLLSEACCSLLTVILSDNTLATTVSRKIPKEAHFGHRGGSDSSIYVTGKRMYNGLKLLPEKLSNTIVSTLTWQAVLRAIIPFLPPFTELEEYANIRKNVLQSQDPQRTISHSINASLKRLTEDAHLRPNLDAIANITSDTVSSLEVLLTALEKLESVEFYTLSAKEKLAILSILCASVYDTDRVQTMQVSHMNERERLKNERDKSEKADKRKTKLAMDSLKNEAVEFARKLNKAAAKGQSHVKSKIKAKKGNVKDPFEPTAAQVQAAFDDMLLLQKLEIDAVLEYPPPLPDISDDEDDALPDAVLSDLSVQERILARRKATSTEKQAKRKLKKQYELIKAQRGLALEKLQIAIDTESESKLKEALKLGKHCLLEGKQEDGTRYCTELMKQAHKTLLEVKERAKKTSLELEFEQRMSEYFTRTEPLGLDRDFNVYWVFEGDSRVFVEIRSSVVQPPEDGNELLHKRQKTSLELESSSEIAQSSESVDGLKREEGMDVSTVQPCPKVARIAMEKLIRPPQPSQYRSTWRYFATHAELRSLCDALDDRGTRERALKEAIRVRFALNDEEDSTEHATVWKTDKCDFIGKEVRRKFKRTFVIGTVVGWLPAEENEGQELFHVCHYDGDEEDLDREEVEEAIEAAACLCNEIKHHKEKDKQSKDEDDRKVLPEDLKVGTGDLDTKLENHDGRTDTETKNALEDEHISITYVNQFNKKGPKSVRDVGLWALRRDMIQKEQLLEPGLRQRGSSWASRAGAQKEWLRILKDQSTDLSLVREAVLALEGAVHETQGCDDRKDTDDEKQEKIMQLQADGWVFEDTPDMETMKKNNSSECEYVGVKVRRFFAGYGKSDGRVVAVLPKQLNDGIAFWHMEHEDGDEEDLDENEVVKGIRLYMNDAIEDPDLEEEEDASEDKSEEEEEAEEEDEQDEFGNSRTLWPSWGVRQRWLRAVKDSQTVAEVALALMSLVDHCVRFGVAIDIDGPATRRAMTVWREHRSRRKSTPKKRRAVASYGTSLRPRR